MVILTIFKIINIFLDIVTVWYINMVLIIDSMLSVRDGKTIFLDFLALYHGTTMAYEYVNHSVFMTINILSVEIVP